ncbi:hypothetical protein ACG04Q_18420 [Roseateles sp. DXS20W]|uniref:Uncharacterized protein n=1 Tax=Pelomonas lactea TaxID=3299030 RepID=A0ABW7GNZ7_9BURK
MGSTDAAAAHLGKVGWVCIGLAALDCALRIAVLAYWALAPDRVPDIPMFTKGVRYPEVQAGVLLVMLPALAAVARPRWLSPRRSLALGVALMVFSFALFILGGVFLSFNVVSGWGPFALSQAITSWIVAARGRSPAG